MKLITKALLASLFFAPVAATAAIVTNGLNTALAPQGYSNYDLDSDGTDDLALARSCCSPNETFVYGQGFAAQFQYQWVNAGSVVDGSLAWTSGGYGYTPVAGNLPGLNYLAIRNTSIGNYFGYASIDFQGAEQTLVSYTYDNTGAAITVGAVITDDEEEVPEPATLALLGLGMVGIGMQRRRKQA